MTMQVPAPTAGYGPFVLVTSAHSDLHMDWDDSGDAIIAIHGPITSYDDSLIGTTGAAISHGCIRLHDADLAQLNTIPPARRSTSSPPSCGIQPGAVQSSSGVRSISTRRAPDSPRDRPVVRRTGPTR